VEIISEVHKFDMKTGEEKIISKEEAQKEALEEKCYFCNELRKINKKYQLEVKV
jgi:hypothetical protein